MTDAGPPEVVDHAARQGVAVLEEAIRGIVERLVDLRGELRASSTRVVWAVILAVVSEVVLRLLGK